MPISTTERTQLKRLGQNIRKQRLTAKLTQEVLSEKADLNLRNLQKIEAGELNILVTTLMRIHAALGCRWENLLAGESGK